MFRTYSPLLSLLGCVVAAGSANVAQAQLGISFDENGAVRVQDGNKPPLVVGPGQSFGGTLTPQGFQGVKVGPDSVAVPVAPNPFQAAEPVPPVPVNGLKVNAGGISISLPQTSGPTAVAISDPLMTSKMVTARELARSARPEVALRYVDELLAMSPQHADALQLKATLMMHDQPREAAACVYQALSVGNPWSWPVLRSRYVHQDQVVEAYRRLQQMDAQSPTLESHFLLAWWERMLNHPAESMAAMKQAYSMQPKDPLLSRLMTEWSVVETADAPPAPQQ